MAKSKEWDKEVVQVVTAMEATKMAPSVEAMIAIEAVTHTEAAMHGEVAMAPVERMAAEAAAATEAAMIPEVAMAPDEYGAVIATASDRRRCRAGRQHGAQGDRRKHCR
ncbi:hypothetical protein [Mesorhizobium neociceri]|uniref:Uncharacterized protein n=1 Tax=Mesorhizobium neociceri TaxID=1307853 RepID=A0A838B734_9HYPH|nr:hypothetical protein [Mesorhizobium neociceri]MBA1141892.1 hypothetical protein [Mesorhizobium neociceri]